ncbi:MAG: UPF0104 family protein [Synechococcales cyanobacterium CRU_2_2]|nr:UPF0104 family protein [Synechococcales cyanobacterium CRU_2_2]
MPIALGLGLLTLAIRTLGSQLLRHPLAEIWQSIATIPRSAVALAVLLTAVNYWILTGYDTLALRYVRHPLSYPCSALVGAIAYAISNNIGFTFLSGGAIRYRFYRRWGVSAGAIAQVILFCNLSFWMGFLSVGGCLFTLEPVTAANLLYLPLSFIRPLGALFLGAIAGCLGWSLMGRRSLQFRQWQLPHLPFAIALGQIAVTFADWASIAALLYVLLPQALLPSFISFLGIYLLAKVAGVISNVPGGLGVFETVILLSLAPADDRMAQVLGVFLAYRGIYYLLPLAIAILLWATYELNVPTSQPSQ